MVGDREQVGRNPEDVTSSPCQHQARSKDKRKARGIPRPGWSAAEKEIILYCHTFSRYEGWGRQGNKVFWEQLQKSTLDKEKLGKTNSRSLSSQITNIHNILDTNNINHIKSRALADAQISHENGTTECDKSRFWTDEERWVLTWAFEFATIKYRSSNQRLYTKCWRDIVSTHCPNKPDMNKVATQHRSLKTRKYFSEHDQYIKAEIQKMLEKDISPITNPILIPGPINEPLVHTGSPTVLQQPVSPQSQPESDSQHTVISESPIALSQQTLAPPSQTQHSPLSLPQHYSPSPPPQGSFHHRYRRWHRQLRKTPYQRRLLYLLGSHQSPPKPTLLLTL